MALIEEYQFVKRAQHRHASTWQPGTRSLSFVRANAIDCSLVHSVANSGLVTCLHPAHLCAKGN